MDYPQAVRSARKARGQGSSRRGEILDAAKRIFLTAGYEGATIRTIAAAVGVSSATLYVYFPDKDSILSAIAESTFGELLVRLEAAQLHEGSALDRFRAGLAAYVEFGLAHPDGYRLTFLAKMITPSGPGRPLEPCAVQAADRSFELLQRNITDLMESGVFAPGEPVRVAEAVWACLHGITALLLDQVEYLESAPDALVGTVLDILMKGLLA